MFNLKLHKTIKINKTIIILFTSIYCVNCFAADNIFSKDFFLDLRKSLDLQEQAANRELNNADKEQAAKQEKVIEKLSNNLPEIQTGKKNFFTFALICFFSLASGFLFHKILGQKLKNSFRKRRLRKKIKVLKKQFTNSYDNSEFREQLKQLLALSPGANNSQILNKLIDIDKELYWNLKNYNQRFNKKQSTTGLV